MTQAKSVRLAKHIRAKRGGRAWANHLVAAPRRVYRGAQHRKSITKNGNGALVEYDR